MLLPAHGGAAPCNPQFVIADEKRELFACDNPSGKTRWFEAQLKPELNKLEEIVTMLANLWDAAYRLPEGPERQNALQEIAGYQIRIVTFVHRLASEP